MPFTNQGNQEIIIDFADPLSAEVLSKRTHDIEATGIYKGGNISVISSSEVSIDPVVLVVANGNENQVRVKTVSSVILEPTPTKPWLVFKWTRNNEEGWFGEFKETSQTVPNDIIFGKALFDGNGNVSDVDKSDRTIPENKYDVIWNGNFAHLKAMRRKPKVISNSLYSIGQNDYIVDVDLRNNNVTLILPSGDFLKHGRELIISDITGNATTNNLTLTPASSDTILGDPDFTFTQDYQSETIYYNSNFNIWMIR